MFAGRARGLGAVRVAQDPRGGHLVPLDPRVVIADDVLVVQARQQRHLTFDPSELLTGWVHLDALHCVITTIEVVFNLEVNKKRNVLMSFTPQVHM